MGWDRWQKPLDRNTGGTKRRLPEVSTNPCLKFRPLRPQPGRSFGLMCLATHLHFSFPSRHRTHPPPDDPVESARIVAVDL